MADRYWRGGTASWDGTAGSKWAATPSGPTGAAVPTTADDVYFDSTSTGTCTIATGNAGAKSINCTGFTGTITGTGSITVSGSITLVSGMTYTHTGTVTIIGTGTLTTAGKSFSQLRVDGSGITVTLGDDLNCGSRTITINRGTFTTSASNYSITAASLSSSGSNSRAINLNGSVVNLSTSTTALNFATSTNLTFTAGTSQINLTTNGADFAGGSQTFYDVSFSGGGNFACEITGTNIFNNLTIAPPSNGVRQIIFSNNQTINGTLTCSGASIIRRISIVSNAVGTSRTLTVANLLADDCDFRDITIAGAAAGISPTRAGNCGGNSGIIFPVAKTVYWNLSGTRTWSSTAWALTPSGTPNANNFPLAQDTATFTNSGAAGTVSMETDFNIGSIDASTRTSAMTLDLTNIELHGSFTLGSGITLTGSGNLTFYGNGIMVLTDAGKTLPINLYVDCGSGTLQLADDLTLTSSASSIQIISGTFNTANNNITCKAFNSNGTLTRAIILGTSTINLTGTSTVWDTQSTGLTFSGASSIINLTDTSSSVTRTFTGGNQTYGTLNIGGATGTSTLIIEGLNTFNTISSTKTVAHTITFSNSQTITNWNVTGTSGNVVTVNSSPVGTQRPITYGGGQTNLDYMSFRDINFSYTLGASNPYLVYAGANSTNNGNNLGIAFIDGTTKKAYRLTSGTTWTVPSDWNSSNNNIYLIGAGGGGGNTAISVNNKAAGGGGGGGGYTALTNFSAAPGSIISYTVGTSTGNSDGGDTTWNGGVIVAGGGKRGTATTTPSSAGGAGGTGDFAGGSGGAGAFGTASSTGYGSGGGGGAGGPNGVGGNGGNGAISTVVTSLAGGGGGGNGGGTNGTNAAPAQGGNGGNNFNGVGGGAGGTTGPGAVGTLGGGGGGGTSSNQGGNGGSGIDIQNTLGGAGGKGGIGQNNSNANAGLYGGGGSGGGVTTTGGANFVGGAGSQGVIFIVYTIPSNIRVETTLARLYRNGNFNTANTMELVEDSTIPFRIDKNNNIVYSTQFNEVSNLGVAMRNSSRGTQISGDFDEVTGIS